MTSSAVVSHPEHHRQQQRHVSRSSAARHPTEFKCSPALTVRMAKTMKPCGRIVPDATARSSETHLLRHKSSSPTFTDRVGLQQHPVTLESDHPGAAALNRHKMNVVAVTSSAPTLLLRIRHCFKAQGVNEMSVVKDETVQPLFHSRRKWVYVRRSRDNAAGYIPFAYCAWPDDLALQSNPVPEVPATTTNTIDNSSPKNTTSRRVVHPTGTMESNHTSSGYLSNDVAGSNSQMGTESMTTATSSSISSCAHSVAKGERPAPTSLPLSSSHLCDVSMLSTSTSTSSTFPTRTSKSSPNSSSSSSSTSLPTSILSFAHNHHTLPPRCGGDLSGASTYKPAGPSSQAFPRHYQVRTNQLVQNAPGAPSSQQQQFRFFRASSLKFPSNTVVTGGRAGRINPGILKKTSFIEHYADDKPLINSSNRMTRTCAVNDAPENPQQQTASSNHRSRSSETKKMVHFDYESLENKKSSKSSASSQKSVSSRLEFARPQRPYAHNSQLKQPSSNFASDQAPSKTRKTRQQANGGSVHLEANLRNLPGSVSSRRRQTEI